MITSQYQSTLNNLCSRNKFV